jgi:hypothetical protein
MAKVPTVLGENMAPKFLGTKKYASGTGGLRDQAIYNFPRKEAIRMAMSYSYDLQAAVLDAWDEAEKALKAEDITPSLPTAFAEALRLAATLRNLPTTMRPSDARSPLPPSRSKTHRHPD